MTERSPYRISIYHNWALRLQLLIDCEDASGAAGTVISFAPHDHRGFKGDPLVLSCVRNHTLLPLTGKSVQR